MVSNQKTVKTISYTLGPDRRGCAIVKLHYYPLSLTAITIQSVLSWFLFSQQTKGSGEPGKPKTGFPAKFLDGVCEPKCI
jgi:hypothetical protein